MSGGRPELADCQVIYHPGKTCRQYFVDKSQRAITNSIKLAFFVSVIPNVVKKRRELFGSDRKTAMRAILKILKQFVRVVISLTACNSLFMVMLCGNGLVRWRGKVPVRLYMATVYALPSVMCLILDDPVRLTGYMGFFLSKAWSGLWSLLKHKQVLPSRGIPHEKALGMALLAGLIGLLSH